ncbi:hypothetical protein T484DRAFT_3183137 [Baffinella frigidus]|nr:hypothetical protein T484DRAFT_3183137 [Cryptophyta sp. CCMP2293]
MAAHEMTTCHAQVLNEISSRFEQLASKSAAERRADSCIPVLARWKQQRAQQKQEHSIIQLRDKLDESALWALTNLQGLRKILKKYTPNPKPQTLNPKPQTLNPKPQTPNQVRQAHRDGTPRRVPPAAGAQKVVRPRLAPRDRAVLPDPAWRPRAATRQHAAPRAAPGAGCRVHGAVCRASGIGCRVLLHGVLELQRASSREPLAQPQVPSRPGLLCATTPEAQTASLPPCSLPPCACRNRRLHKRPPACSSTAPCCLCSLSLSPSLPLSLSPSLPLSPSPSLSVSLSLSPSLSSPVRTPQRQTQTRSTPLSFPLLPLLPRRATSPWKWLKQCSAIFSMCLDIGVGSDPDAWSTRRASRALFEPLGRAGGVAPLAGCLARATPSSA